MDNEHVYEIDPSKKYLLVTNRLLTRAEKDQLRTAWEKFLNDPDEHVLFMHGGEYRLVRVEEPETMNG